MFSQIFIERPRLAVVVSIIFTLAGLIALFNIPVGQYPQITPPEIRVTATYPGANAQVVADTVAAPIEKEVNGVEKMLYMSSSCSNDGRYTLAVTFAVGTDPDIDQVNLQNRIQLAMSKLPQDVVDQGIDVRRRSSDILGAVEFFSPQGTRDKLFLSNYVSRNIKDALVRIHGVSDVFIFGEFEYSMRIWMDPERLTARELTADDVIQAIRQQNIQAAVGSIGTSPAATGQQLQYTLRARGLLDHPVEFENIVVRSNDPEALAASARVLRGSHSLLVSATGETAGVLWPIAKESEHALAITAPTMDELTALSASIKKAGFNDLVLEFRAHSLAERFQTQSIARRAALRDTYKPLG